MQYNEVQSEKVATKKEQTEKYSPENAGTFNSNTTTASNPRREPFSVRQDNQYGFASKSLALLWLGPHKEYKKSCE